MRKPAKAGFDWSLFEKDHVKPPTGSITANDYADKFGVSVPTGFYRLRAAAKRGELIMTMCRNPQTGQRTQYFSTPTKKEKKLRFGKRADEPKPLK